MNANPWLSKLRHLLHQPPSEVSWGALCLLFEELPQAHTAIALEYAQEHLQAWPVGLRSAKLVTHPDDAPPWWPLVRFSELHRADGPLARRFWSGLLDTIVALDFKGLRGCVHPLSRLDWPGTPLALSLAWTDVGDQGAELLIRTHWVRHLKRLDLHRNSLTAAAVEALTSGDALQNIAWLDLSQNAIIPSGVEALAKSNITSLHALSLAANHTPRHTHSAALEALCHPSACTLGLKALDFNNNLLDQAAVAQLVQFSSLTHLDLHGGGLSDDGLIALTNSQAPLTWLNLATGHHDRARLTERGLLTLARSSVAKRLRSLNLSGCELTPLALEAILSEMPDLQVLVLRQVPLEDEGAAVLARLGSPRLKVLDLEGAEFGSQGLGALGVSSALSGLTRLNIAGNARVGGDDLERLVHSPMGRRLRCLGFPNAYLRSSVQTNLGELFPELEEEWGPPSQYSLMSRRRFEGEVSYDPLWSRAG